jgi:hypothetical protein
MGERFDRLRSLLRTAAAGTRDALGKVGPVPGIRAALRELRDRRQRIPERAIARAVLRAGGVTAASVRTRGGRIEITAELESGRAIRAALVPEEARFAPRGAKEVVFAVDPGDAAADPKVREIAGLVAAQIARALWAPLLPPPSGVDDGGLVDRDAHRLRIDLRTVPVVRSAQSSTTAMFMDAISIEGFAVDEEGLSFRIALPKLP